MKTRTYAARQYGEIRENDDGTFDLLGVEILEATGPVHGKGSPPEGDYWTVEQLEEMAAAARELQDAGELTPPNKLGHPDAQTLVANSIDAGELPAEGEMPAIGWLENQRVEGTKLLADVMHVPRLVMEAITKGAWRTRSTELSQVTSQTITDEETKKPKVYDWVVTGLAWLGGKMPAVRTLGDVVKLYEGDGDVKQRCVVTYAVDSAEVVWDSEAGFQDLMSDLQAALNPYGDTNLWVCDVDTDRTKAIVEDYAGDKTWVVPFTVDDNGEPTPAVSADWVEVDTAYVRASRDLEDARRADRATRADIRGVKGKSYSDEQRKTFAEAVGLEADKVTDEMLEKAGVLVEETPERSLEADEQIRELAAETATTKRELAETREELRVERRNAFIEGVLKEGRIEPGQREKVEKLYDADPDTAREFVQSLNPNEDLARTYGADEGDGNADEEKERELEDAYLARTLNVAVEELV